MDPFTGDITLTYIKNAYSDMNVCMYPHQMEEEALAKYVGICHGLVGLYRVEWVTFLQTTRVNRPRWIRIDLTELAETSWTNHICILYSGASLTTPHLEFVYRSNLMPSHAFTNTVRSGTGGKSEKKEVKSRYR